MYTLRGSFRLMSDPYHHGALPAALLAAAEEALEAGGPARLSIRDLARRVGVSASAPYRHFADRAALLEALAASGYRKAAAALAGQGSAGAGAVAAVWSGMAERSPGLFAVMATTRSAAAGSDLEGAVLEWLGEVARALDGDRRRVDPEESVRRAVACWAAVHGLIALHSAGALAAIDEWMLPDVGDLARRAARC